jgi:DNA-3-methyladenine glycosylase II
VSASPSVSPVSPVAVRHVAAADPVLAAVIERVGEIDLRLEPDLWWSLVDAIVSQQLSIAAAATIAGRIRALGSGEAPPSPAELLGTPDDDLRSRGLSRAKVTYVKDLATRWLEGSLEHERIPSLADQEIIDRLVQVKGIGRWTAEMSLIFCLGRPDVLPVDDLGLQAAAQIAYDLPDRPGREELTRLAEPWRPYRTTASLYLWRSRRVS